jgi:DNA repair exonuclease SbcCD nuclease subunit
MKTVRFIHTSDVHLDTSFSASGFSSRLGDRKREAIRGAFRRILEAARSGNVNLVLIAGDLFELERITPDTFEFLKRQFESLGEIRVFISPGNHDPCVPGSPYKEEAWPQNVHIFRTEEFQFVELPEMGVRVAGFGFTHSQLETRLFQQLPVLPGDLFNIVLCHGSDISRVPEGKSKYGPFTIEEIAGKNVQYCALGHYHQQHRLFNPVDTAEIWYSGIPEGRGWDEEGACGYLLGEIEGGRVRVENQICSQYDLKTITINCDAFTTREQIVEAVLEQRGRHYNSNTILRVQLTGAVDPRLELSFSELEERLAGEVLHIRWDDQTHSALDFEALAQEKTLRGRFIRILNERIATASEEERAALERARQYGLEALSGREVRLR